jgi:hypothetical protein
MSSGVSSLLSGPGAVNVHAHCCATTRTVRSAGGSVCLMVTHTRIAAMMMTTSQTSTSACGMLIHCLRCFSLPVMYCARTPSFARNRKSSQKNIASAAMNHTPTSTVTRTNSWSTSPE